LDRRCVPGVGISIPGIWKITAARAEDKGKAVHLGEDEGYEGEENEGDKREHVAVG
jgi:hypothetical protein